MSDTHPGSWQDRAREIAREGEVVFRLSSTSGDECIYRLEGLYFALGEGGQVLGPHPGICELLASETWGRITPASRAVTCAELGREALLACLRTDLGETAVELDVNGVPCFLSDDGELDLRDFILYTGEQVFSVFWDSGAPGAGADSEYVFRFSGRYHAVFSSGDLSAPYPTLRDALQTEGLGWVTTATVSVHCSELTTEELLAYLEPEPGNRDHLLDVNNEPFYVTAAGEILPLPDGLPEDEIAPDSSESDAGVVDAYTRSLELHPGSALVLFRRGSARAIAGDLPGAFADFTEGLRLCPDGAYFLLGVLHLGRARVRAAVGDPAGAVEDYDQAIPLLDSGERAGAYLGRGRARAAVGNHAAAVEDCTAALFWLSGAEAAEAHFLRALARGAAGDRAGAISDYTEAIRLYPDTEEKGRAYNNRGFDRAHEGDRTGAVADYSEAILLGPDHPDASRAYHNRGCLRAEEGDHLGAIEDYTRALSLYPDSGGQARAHHSRATSYRKLGRYPEAIADYTMAILIYPDGTDRANAYACRAFTLDARGDHAGAIADYSRAISLHSDGAAKADAYFNRGLARRAEGDHPGALDDFTESIPLSGSDAARAQALTNRGVELALSGRPQEAIQDYALAMQLDPGCPGPVYDTACACGLLGDAGQVCAWLERAIALEPRCRDSARTDSDFDAIRTDPRFGALVAGPEA